MGRQILSAMTIIREWRTMRTSEALFIVSDMVPWDFREMMN